MKTTPQSKESASPVDEFGEFAEKYWKPIHQQAPTELFHYCRTDSLKSIIQSGKMWASAFECMNDSKEIRKGLGIAKSEILNILPQLPMGSSPNTINGWADFIDGQIESPWLRPYILSFCADGENSHLWEKYADEHRGGMLKFKNLSQDLNLTEGCFVKVNYDEVDARRNLREQLQILTDIFNKKTSASKDDWTNLFVAYLQSIFRFAIELKEPQWSPEKEWRLIIFKDIDRGRRTSHGDIQFRFRDNALVDYLEVSLCQVRMELDYIKAGCRFPDLSKNSLKLFMANFPLIKLL